MEKLPGIFESKLPDTGTTIFTIMSQMAQEYGAINLSQGFPDFPISHELAEAVTVAMKAGHNQYAPMQGLPALREVIAQKASNSYGQYIAPEQVLVTPGATSALYAAITAIVQPGDEVLIFEPAYDSYAPSVRLQGGIPVFSQLEAPHFKPNWEQVKSLINDKTKLVILNTPHNPTGAVWQSSDWEALERLGETFPFFVLSDEVYEHIVFENPHHSVLSRPFFQERFAAVYSFGKTFHATGWKVGYVIASKYWHQEIIKVHQFMNFSVHTPSQHALACYLKVQKNIDELPVLYKRKRDLFLEGMKNSRFTFLPAQGTYFQTLDYSSFSNKKDSELATYFTREKGVAAIPISAFYQNPASAPHRYLRFCFAKKDETLQAAIEKLCKI